MIQMYRFAIHAQRSLSAHMSPPPPTTRTQIIVTKSSRFISHVPTQHFSTTLPPLILNTNHLLVNLKPNSNHTSVFHFVWLRDNCPCPKCVHSNTRQKLHTSGDIPTDIQPICAHWVRPHQPSEGKDRTDTESEWVLEIEWPTFMLVSRYGQQVRSELTHVSQYTLSFLNQYDYSSPKQSCSMDPVSEPWCVTDRFEHMHIDYNSLPPLEELGNDDGQSNKTIGTVAERTRNKTFPAQRSMPLSVLQRLATHGLVFLHNVPTDRGDDYIETVAKRFGHGLRNTFYGLSWDVKSDQKSTNIAYTNLPLGLHMDLMYFESPPGIQFLHMLKTNVNGGTSVFLDMLHAWQTFVTTHPKELSSVLMQVPTSFHYTHQDNPTNPHYLKHTHPMVKRTSSHMYYSPPFQSPQMDMDVSNVLKWYQGMRAWELHLQTIPKLNVDLREGDLVVFSNRRVLHGRTGFSGEVKGNIERHLRGCYVDQDEFMDRLRINIINKIG